MKRKMFALILAVVMLVSTVVLFAACNNTGKLKVAYHTNYGGAGTLVAGIKQGFFAKYGLEIEPVGFTSGPSEVAAMGSGDLQYGYIGNGAANLAVQGQVNIIAYDKLGDSEEIIANKAKGIETMQDLKGKTLATTLGTTGEDCVNAALEAAGLEKGTGPEQVNVINMDMSNIASAVVSGSVDAVCVWEQYKLTVKELWGANAVVLASTGDFDSLASISTWLVTPDYYEAHKEEVVKFVAALIESIDYWAKNEDQVITWCAEFLELDVEVLKPLKGQAQLKTLEEYERDLNNGWMEQKFQVQQDAFLAAGTITEKVPLENYIMFDLMKEAIQLIKTTNAK